MEGATDSGISISGDTISSPDSERTAQQQPQQQPQIKQPPVSVLAHSEEFLIKIVICLVVVGKSRSVID